MAHAEHFLSRLDRLPRAEVDLALELYRDPDLVRAVLAEAGLPDGAERIAISIDDPVLGPFLIVTRDGRFVTCLGRGMRAGDRPVVARADLEVIARKIERLRVKMTLEARVGERATYRLLQRLVVAPDTVSREDFLAVAAWEPLLGEAFVDIYLDMSAEVSKQTSMVHLAPARGPRADEALHRYWNLLHASGHMALLAATTSDRDHYASMTAPHAGSRAAFSCALTGSGVMAFILKGAWAAGRIGKLALADYKRALAQDLGFFDEVDTLLALLAIGMRASGTRAEIIKALRAAHPRGSPEKQPHPETVVHGMELCCNLVADILERDAAGTEETRIQIGESYVAAAEAEMTDDERHELVRTLPLLSWANGITDGAGLLTAMSLVAATARGGPEQFYLPRDLARALQTPWEPSRVWAVIEPFNAAARARRKPSVRATSVGRNDPCPCGSGRKWKKCCGA